MLEEPILKKKSKTKNLKKFIPFLGIICLVVMVTGISFAFFSDYRTGVYTHTITGGKLGVIFDENTGNNIIVANAYPLSDTEALTRGIEFEFTITGYNESEEHVYYSVELVYGEDSTTKTRFPDTDLKLSFYKNDNPVFENQIYDNLNNQVLDYGYITSGTTYNNPTINTYKLRIWINDNVMITNTPDNLDTTGKSVYSSSEFINHYANFRINVTSEINYDVQVVNYNLNGGIGAINPTGIGEAITLMKPVKVGYIFAGWSTTASATTSQYQSGDIYSGEATTLYAVWEETKTLYDKLETSLMSNLTTADIDGTRFVYGSDVDNNYVWYSGKLWRIVALNNDGTIKLVTQGNMTAIYWSTSLSTFYTSYTSSQVYTWLKEEFLPTLSNAENILVDSSWDYTTYSSFPTSKITTTNVVKNEKVGLLNIYEFMMTGGTAAPSTTNTFLNNGYDWLTLTPESDDESLWKIDEKGDSYEAVTDGDGGIRPAINLVADIEFLSGSGQKSDPYLIDVPVNNNFELLNSRISGEYIKFDGELYRIVGIEEINGQKLTKITMADYSHNSNTLITSMAFGEDESDKAFNTSTGVGYYLDNWYNSSISDYYKSLIATAEDDGVVWYIGYGGATTDYVELKGGTKVSATIGLPRYGEMFSSQFGDGSSSSVTTWLITETNLNAWYIWASGSVDHAGRVTYTQGVRPSFYLKSNVIINDGLGTKENPFEISFDGIICKISKPSSNYISVGENVTYYLQCTSASEFSDSTITASDFEISDSEVMSISAIAKSVIDDGYEYAIEVTAKGAGGASLVLKPGVLSDSAGNTNDEIASSSLIVRKADTAAPVCTFSGPTVGTISKDGEITTSEFVLECTDDMVVLNDSEITSSDFDFSTSGIVGISEITKNIITENGITVGYKYNISVVAIDNGTTSLILKSGVVSDNVGKINESVTSSTITVAEISLDSVGPTCVFSGPSVANIYVMKEPRTAEFYLECTDDSEFNDSEITVSDINVGDGGEGDSNGDLDDPTSSGEPPIMISSVTKSSITNGYKYTITVSSSLMGQTFISLKSGVISDSYGNTNATVSSSNIKVSMR